MKIHTLVIGGGQAGLAMSAALTDERIDHVVLERGRLANAWRTERWDSLRLLTPNWMSRLPGYRYDGDHPDGFMTATELLGFFERYARLIDAPVMEHTEVHSVRRDGGRFTVRTNHGRWTAENVVVATGAAAKPSVPAMARSLPDDIAQFTPSTYKRPGQLPAGGVLVVGASASGAQLAGELRAAGREVVVAVGRHTRLPRRYRGGDIMWWLDRAGVFDDRVENLRDPGRARKQPSLQLVGGTPPRTLDLSALQRAGVRLAGRLLSIDGSVLHFADDLTATMHDAELRCSAVLDRVDETADALHAPRRPARPAPLQAPATPATIDLRRERITNVLWATGFRRTYPWLQTGGLDTQGEIRQRAGVSDIPGLYTVGMRFQRTRKSNFLDGVGADALWLARLVATTARRKAA
jgi:putative flavoprotein involved in K+ transport